MHLILMAVFIATPPAALFAAAFDARHRPTGRALGGSIFTLVAGFVLGIAMSVVYAVGIGGAVPIGQVMLAGYFAASMLYLLKGLDVAIVRLLLLALTRKRTGRPSLAQRQWAAGLRPVVLFGLGLPTVMALVMTYRIKVNSPDTPATSLGWKFAPVEFDSIDGIHLSAWWIPAKGNSADPRFGQRTVILCHGLAANKSNQLTLARDLVPAGYNLLSFDFRAHGQSGGQLTSFGDRERYDVLGAVRWLRSHHPNESRKIFGVGASMGGAALIAAACNDSPEGRAIDAVAVVDTYDSMPALARSVGNLFRFSVAGWLIRAIGVPLAAVQTGADLSRFAPADLVPQLSPRPFFVIHGLDDRLIDFELGQSLFNSAEQPKTKLWLRRGDHNDVIDSDETSKALLWFFNRAEPAV